MGELLVSVYGGLWIERKEAVGDKNGKTLGERRANFGKGRGEGEIPFLPLA